MTQHARNKKWEESKDLVHARINRDLWEYLKSHGNLGRTSKRLAQHLLNRKKGKIRPEQLRLF